METRILVDGEWVTRRVDVDTVLRHHNAQDGDDTFMETLVDKPPFKGVLTQTVVRSPLLHHILPVRLRDLEHNDVAFIGEDFVRIQELKSDGFLWEIARKENFGARIRNACVAGSLEDYQADLDTLAAESLLKIEDDDLGILHTQPLRKRCLEPLMPPQIIVLQLDTGESVFLTLRRDEHGIFNLVIASRYRVMKPMLDTHPGMYLDVDPTSRYMAVGCSETHSTIYELQSRNELQEQFSKGHDLTHVKSDIYMPVSGVLQNMAFLHPISDLVVLILIIVRKGKSRLMIYEWTSDTDIRQIKALSYTGHLMPELDAPPLLLIPLRFNTAFILVTEGEMMLCKGILEGEPQWESCDIQHEVPTEHHHGVGPPLWVAWTRPTYRTSAHINHRDDIYIVREDGFLKFLEIDAHEFVETDVPVGKFDGRCGSALACIDYRSPDRKTGDLLITGGDSSSGGCYLVQARETPLLIQPIENWTPVQDIVAVSTSPLTTSANRQTSSASRHVRTPDRLFACVGKGSTGMITEFIFGVEARIGLYFDCDVPILQAWPIPYDQVTHVPLGGTLFLLSIGNSSIALRLSDDEQIVEPVDDETLKIDLEVHTIAVANIKDYTVQVTEKNIIISNASHRIIYTPDQTLHVQEGGNTIGLGHAIQHAIIDDGRVIYTTTVDGVTYLLILEFDSSLNIGVGEDTVQDGQTLTSFAGHVTALANYTLNGAVIIIVAEYDSENGHSWLKFTPRDSNHNVTPENVDISKVQGLTAARSRIECLVVDTSEDGQLVLLCGLSHGSIVKVLFKGSEMSLSYVEVCIGPISIRKDIVAGNSRWTAHCDNKTFVITESTLHGNISLNQLWYTDASNPGLPALEITSIAGFVESDHPEESARLIVVVGSQLYLTSPDFQPKIVPRHIEVKGTPTRLLYSDSLEALVVATSVNGKSTILFIDPDTGANLSCPLDGRGGKKVSYASGLGRANDRFFRLVEWKYEKNHKIWNFIIACTSSGKLLIISAEEVQREARTDKSLDNTPEASNESTKRRISYYTRHVFKAPEPVYSVIGFPQGLLWCAGEKLLCDVLELTDRKFRRVAEYQLPSLARTMHCQDGEIHVLTQEHSVLILELLNEGDIYSIRHKTSDGLSRLTLDHTVMSSNESIANQGAIHLVSDKFKSFAGLWPTTDAVADTLDTVFEGQLSESVLKFVTAKCRPSWDPCWHPQSSALVSTSSFPPNAISAQETLGLSIGGTITKFTLVDFEAWEFLRFVFDLCLRSESVCDLTYTKAPLSLESKSEPNIMRHIDGDILKRCVDKRLLKEVLITNTADVSDKEIMQKLRRLVIALHGGVLGDLVDDEAYIEQAYKDLELYLRPVL